MGEPKPPTWGSIKMAPKKSAAKKSPAKKAAPKKTATKKKATPKKTGAKKEKKKKDPNAPKKPAQGYILWTMTARKDLLKKKPNLAFTEQGKELGAMWKKVSDADKAKWKEGGSEYKKAHKGK